MKGLLATIALFALAAIPAAAQPETLIRGDVEHNGYGGLSVRMSEMNGTVGALAGLTGGWILDHRFVVGASGYGLATDVGVADPTSAKPSYLKLGYGGIDLGYIYNPDDLVHFTGSALFAAGGMQFTSYPASSGWSGQEPSRPTDVFYVIEPGVSAEMNVASYFRVNVGGSYRFVSGADLQGIGNSDIAGPSANITFKFGGF